MLRGILKNVSFVFFFAIFISFFGQSEAHSKTIVRYDINFQKGLKAILISFFFIYLTNNMAEGNSLLTQNFFISISIYSVLSFVALYGYDLNKILGLFLFFSISLLSPSLYPNFEGELFPITYVVFALFLAYILGIEMYKRWKTSL